MASSAVATLMAHRPTHPQLALAMAIVKYKPPDKSIKDYILHIRQFVKGTKSSVHFVSPDEFFDSVTFWQQAYEESEAEQSKLHNRIFELEQRNDGLLAKLRMEDVVDNNAADSTKRKSDIAASSEPSLKRPRGLESARIDLSMSQQIILGATEGKSLSFMWQIGALQNALQKRPNYSNLATMAATLCKTAEKELLSTVQKTSGLPGLQPSKVRQTKQPDLVAVTRGVEVAFQLAYKTLHKFSGAKNGKPHCGQVTYYLVCLFESTMTALAQHCTAVSKHISSTAKTLPKTNSKSQMITRSTTKKMSDVQNPPDEIGPPLAGLLNTMALSLDLTRPEDQQLMEGFLFTFIRRTGRILSLFVFENLQMPTGVPLPQGLEAMKQENLSSENARLEAKYLVWLLEKLLAVLDHDSIARSQFVVKVRHQLQQTLLRAVWGDDPLFQNGLMRPATPPAQNLGVQKADQQSISDWFTHELWRLIGWDILSSVLASS